MNLFPTLPGLSFPVTKVPTTSTRKLEAASGVDYGARNWSAPRWKFTLPIEVLRQYGSFTEWQTLVGFILGQAGMFAPFLFNDTTDNTVVGQQIGVGNGTQTAFPLVRAIAGYIEPIYYCNSLNNVYLSGALQPSGFILTQSGYYGPDTVTFASPPANGVPVTADFNFYFVCRFLQDDPDIELFTGGRWSVKQLQMFSLK
jgi:uncharacterized protein (TIGR02217 family)